MTLHFKYWSYNFIEIKSKHSVSFTWCKVGELQCNEEELYPPGQVIFHHYLLQIWDFIYISKQKVSLHIQWFLAQNVEEQFIRV